MKKITFISLLCTASLSFAQQSDNQIIKQKKSQLSLNMDFFKMDIKDQKRNSLSQIRNEVDTQRLKSIDNIPIFAPQGEFFLEIYEVEPHIDEKINIFPLEKSKHFWKTVG